MDTQVVGPRESSGPFFEPSDLPSSPHASAISIDEANPENEDTPSSLETQQCTNASAENPSVKGEHQPAPPRMNQVTPFVIATDVFVLAVPIALLVFLFVITALHDRKAGETTYARWQNAAAILATMFPMIFASVFGRCMYEFAHWRVERGVTLGFLEQLLGCRTFGSALGTLFHLRVFRLSGILLVFLWAFSPLGAQSLLRVMTSQFVPNITDTNLQYFDTSGTTGLAKLRIVGPEPYQFSQIQLGGISSMLKTLLLLPTTMRLDAMDPWNNVKIPFLPQNFDSQRSWTPAPSQPELEAYSSIAGVPIIDVPVGNTTTFLESSYLELQCSNISTVKYTGQYAGVEQNASAIPIDLCWDANALGFGGPNEAGADNGSWCGSDQRREDSTVAWSIALNRFVDIYWLSPDEQPRRFGSGNDSATHLAEGFDSPGLLAEEDGIEAGPTRLLFQGLASSHMRNMPLNISAHCDVQQRYVESRVECRRDEGQAHHSCVVAAQRPSRQVHAPENVSQLSFPRVFHHISENLPKATQNFLGMADMGLRYLNDPFLKNIEGFDPQVMFRDIDNHKFSRRLSQLLNTYILLSSFDTGYSLEEAFMVSPIAKTRAKASQLVLVYRVSPPWMAMAITSCILLLVGGVMSVIFRHLALGPEVLGYVSTVIRDSRFMETGGRFGRLDGIEISKKLKSKRIRFGYSEMTHEEQRLMGVGLESDIQSIHEKRR
ncbi:hypothetical protein HJFPF1_05895 [Paramyrothecium foliicola]|nr:hypothetical protein HJFPF1_05895 [Paramyrothecium foliicola]